MIDQTRDTVGELTIAETMLGELLRDLLEEVSGEHVRWITTGRAAKSLLRHAKSGSAWATSDVVAWLKRVVQVVEERNKVVHAVALDRCVTCKRSSRFMHHGSEVNRSPDKIRTVAGQIDVLTAEGVELAKLISGVVNAQYVAEAKTKANETQQVQSPRQVLIGQNLHQCGECSGHGEVAIISGPTAVLVVPKSQ